ncbi:hypothetical protein [Pseudomonas sp. LRF_L74]|uniref:hypothetical protein n=1 Tax=Pseudomonas sp. LRF_L74 TaxID=3369422 RepID=UPI003F633FBE
MSIFSRFFGRKDAGKAQSSGLVANPQLKGNVSLQVVFPAGLPRDQSVLTARLRGYHPEMAGASCDISTEVEQFFALAGWGRHVVQMVGFDLSSPQESIEACVAPAHYSQALKEQVRAHASHILLYYAGYEDDPLEQYVALAAVSGPWRSWAPSRYSTKPHALRCLPVSSVMKALAAKAWKSCVACR